MLKPANWLPTERTSHAVPAVALITCMYERVTCADTVKVLEQRHVVGSLAVGLET